MSFMSSLFGKGTQAQQQQPLPTSLPWRTMSVASLAAELQQSQRRAARLHDELQQLAREQADITAALIDRISQAGGPSGSDRRTLAAAAQPAPPPPPSFPSLKLVLVRGTSPLTSAADLHLWSGLLRLVGERAPPLWLHVVQVDAADAAAVQREIGSVDSARMRSMAGALRSDAVMQAPSGVLVVWCLVRAGGRIEWAELHDKMKERIPQHGQRDHWTRTAELSGSTPAAAPSALPVSVSLCITDRIRDGDAYYSAPPPTGPSADAHRSVQSLCAGRVLPLLVSQSQVDLSRRQANGAAGPSDAMLLVGSGVATAGGVGDQQHDRDHTQQQSAQQMLQAGLDSTALRANQTSTDALAAWMLTAVSSSSSSSQRV